MLIMIDVLNNWTGDGIGIWGTSRASHRVLYRIVRVFKAQWRSIPINIIQTLVEWQVQGGPATNNARDDPNTTYRLAARCPRAHLISYVAYRAVSSFSVSGGGKLGSNALRSRSSVLDQNNICKMCYYVDISGQRAASHGLGQLKKKMKLRMK